MRSLQDVGYRSVPVEDLSAFSRDMSDWLGNKAKLKAFTWLLAYAEDGVIWGVVGADGLLLSPKYAPLLDRQTLREARLFGKDGELHLWKVGDDWRAYQIEDIAQTAGAYDEYQRLWGVERAGWDSGFTLVHEGRAGLQQALPLDIPADLFPRRNPRFHPTLLQTRHYFGYDEATGATTIVMSRLVGLQTETRAAYRKREESYE